MRHVFIINPNAGKGKAHTVLKPQIDEYCQAANLDYIVKEAASAAESRAFVKEQAEKGDRVRFYACGGDGTLFEVVNGAYKYKNAEVAVIPMGSGNDFVRLFGNKEKFRNVEAQVKGTAIDLDLIRCGDWVAINQCSMGLDAEVCAKQVYFKKLPFMTGETSYVAALVYCFLRKMKNDFEVSIDGNTAKKMRVLFCVAGNSRWYGGGFKAAPAALPDDGGLDFVIVEKTMPRIKLLPLVSMYKNGEHLNKYYDFIHLRRGQKMTIHSEKLAAVNVDGECYYTHDATFEIIPSGIKFVIPTTSTYIEDRAGGKLNNKIPETAHP